MNSSLDKIRVIDAGEIDSAYYFQSLLQKAYGKGLLSDYDIERIQYDCIHLLAYKTERYNSGDSSSIRIEKAQDIMTSNLFTIGIWLKTYPRPDDAVTALQNESINEIYEKGRRRIHTMLASAKTVHTRLLRQLADTENVFYKSTVDSGIKGFFKLYYPDFSAHETHITADYPTFHPIPNLSGIEFIKAYLYNLYYENLFCSYFAADDIHHLLCGYAEDYAEQVINIYEQVLLAALGCTISGTDPKRLDITEYKAKQLCRQFADIPQNEIAAIIKNAVSKLICILNCPQKLARYLDISLPLVISQIQTAVRTQTLARVFVLPAFPENKPKMILSFGHKMEDEQYRKIIEEIGQCRYTADKMEIIKETVHSLADLEEVLLDTYLTGEEIRAVLQRLDLSEFSALVKKYQIKEDRDTNSLNAREQRLRHHLKDYLSAMTKEQQETVIKTSEILRIEYEKAK